MFLVFTPFCRSSVDVAIRFLFRSVVFELLLYLCKLSWALFIFFFVTNFVLLLSFHFWIKLLIMTQTSWTGFFSSLKCKVNHQRWCHLFFTSCSLHLSIYFPFFSFYTSHRGWWWWCQEMKYWPNCTSGANHHQGAALSLRGWRQAVCRGRELH